MTHGKFIQILCVPLPPPHDVEFGAARFVLYALTAEGDVWRYNALSKVWSLLPDLTVA